MNTYNNVKEFLDAFSGNGYSTGRAFYKSIGCGPWTCYTLRDGGKVYYEDDRANKDDWYEECDGVQFGSIVEGSDVEIDAEWLSFPFTSDELDAVLAGIDKEATFYWKRDNLEHFYLESNAGSFAFEKGWFEPVAWPKSVPADVKKWADEMSEMREVNNRYLEHKIPVGETKGMVDLNKEPWTLHHMGMADCIF